ncbi:unnamed protein product [Linum tenue]|uniref:DNL-type domain-containing protein n=1 Tax=Linum tenue TaxID=586396 RepID=A0AAV0LPJ8_9ROSI|nr:unnamed protein product [Linum tenue]
MEALSSSAATIVSSSSSSSLSFFSQKRNKDSACRFLRCHNSSPKNDGDNSDLRSSSDSKDSSSIVPFFNHNALSKDDAMGLVLSAASLRGWTTGSGMEGPPAPAGAEDGSNTEKVSTLPWSLFTKSPRRRMRVAFTCNVCGQRTTRAINPHAYTDGTVFVQCYVNPSFKYKDSKWDGGVFRFFDVDEDEDDHDGDDGNVSFPI